MPAASRRAGSLSRRWPTMPSEPERRPAKPTVPIWHEPTFRSWPPETLIGPRGEPVVVTDLRGARSRERPLGAFCHHPTDRQLRGLTPMANPMPLIHAARRTRRNREEGNPFTTDRVIGERIAALTIAYLRCRNARIANLLKVEIDLLESLI